MLNSCDLLSNCIFDVLKNNRGVIYLLSKTVVICFQIVSLTYWKTTAPFKLLSQQKLWFAFKLYLWRIEKQRRKDKIKQIKCCDLLSNCIFDVLKNNWVATLIAPHRVVICFQIVSLTYWKTTYNHTVTKKPLLWFAFKLYLWRIEKQLSKSLPSTVNCCDLLSNCIFDVLKNNKISLQRRSLYVVICFQIVSLTYWKTTRIFAMRSGRQLWFAFKLYLWRIEKQPHVMLKHLLVCCDLLSNCIFDVLKNNHAVIFNRHEGVVICFQIVSLTYWKTTLRMRYGKGE